jgi:protein involved in polysaccharide export with SLBB domain
MYRIFHNFSALLLAAVVLSSCACAPADAPRGKVLKVVIYGEYDLSGEYVIARDGTIAMPLVGPIQVAGQPVSALPGIIADAYRGDYLVDPKVSVEVKSQ